LLEEAGAVGLPIILPEITNDRAIDHAILVRFRMKIASMILVWGLKTVRPKDEFTLILVTIWLHLMEPGVSTPFHLKKLQA
jgi:hypothetical protein